MKFKAKIAEGFKHGNSNTDFAVDGPHLTDDEIRVIQKFMEDIAQGNPLRGKNKPSWVDDDHNFIPGTEGYREENYWHYHCGPAWKKFTFRGFTYDLKFNPGGEHSKQCIHYAKISEDQISIVGYSRDHLPFKLSRHKDNPFFSEEDDDE
ncbi:hypothetical protein [Serratia sp. (in: enterobacteria)]|uniref:hypothetical protein n=1 Tax=Serratia sp. (in: enterobacteria) TaxID=616 RepID=UPI0028BE5147|nr:hypothetical protein [Serratia sp. (in: enterobacteria)]